MEQTTFTNRGILLLHTQKWKVQVMRKINHMRLQQTKETGEAKAKISIMTAVGSR
jgi:hypothetical protein